MTDLLSPESTGEISTLDHHDTDRTRNLTGFLGEGRLRRPDATGEHPIYIPQTIARVDEPTRLATGETLVLPVDATPVVPRPAAPTVYLPLVGASPPRYRGEHRREDPPWLWALVGAVLLLIGEAIAAGLLVLAVATW